MDGVVIVSHASFLRLSRETDHSVNCDEMLYFEHGIDERSQNI